MAIEIYDGPLKTDKDLGRLMKSLKASKSQIHEIPQRMIEDLDRLIGSKKSDVKSKTSGIRYIPEDIDPRIFIYGSSAELAAALANSDFPDSKEDMNSYGRF